MWKIVFVLALYITNTLPAYITTAAISQQEVPSYAKWGQLALKETQANYPKAKIIDYLHEGSESQNGVTIEKFKLWLREGDIEFGVFVRIKYITETERVVSIQLKKTVR